LISDGKRIIQFFIKNEKTEEVNYINYIKNKNLLRFFNFFKKALIIVSILIIIIQFFVGFKATEQLRSKSKLRGIWKTELFILEQDTLAPLTTDVRRWKYFIIDYKEKAIVKKMNDSINRYSFKEIPNENEIVFKNIDALSEKFKYKISNSNHLELKGFLNEKEIIVKLKKIPETKFRLLNRGFHWINETTYNY